ncbi:MAG: NAD-dependent epimerase/dehydratase family protein [Flavobacteriales bacterium]|jgi:nucleoside-diphosphate-sugar epimerase|nr:NAD-dependent epimerase/dehydratase family protein [Flavobacteriales bacterium]
MAKALITGATGLVGINLLIELLDKKRFQEFVLPYRSEEKKQFALSYLAYHAPHANLETLHWKKGDLLDFIFVESLMEKDLRIFHCAAIISFKKKDGAEMIAKNQLLTENMVNGALSFPNTFMVFVSSIAAMGRADNNEVISEDTYWKPSDKNSNYAESKYESEMIVWRGIEEGLQAVIVNPAIILGAYKHSQMSTELFQMLYKGFNYYSEGINAFVDVKDVAQIMALLEEQNIQNERFILSAGNFSYHQIFDWITEGFNKPKPKIQVTMSLGKKVLWVEKFLSIFGRKRKLTKENLETSLQENKYDSSKLIHTLEYHYSPVQKSIQWHCEDFLKFHKE